MNRAYSLDDILIRPQFSELTTRREVNLSTDIGGTSGMMDHPIISAAMNTVTEWKMANEMWLNGGFGIIHRYMNNEERIKQLNYIRGECGIAISSNDYKFVEDVMEEGLCNYFVFDVAHGHMEKALSFGEWFGEIWNPSDYTLIGGNITEQNALIDLAGSGFDGARIGIGEGSVCTTRSVSGVGNPLASSLIELAEIRDRDFEWFRLIVDGGIRNTGDIVKCFTPNHKILTADLKWKSPFHLSKGEAVIGFDEFGPNRKYRTSIIEHIDFIEMPTYEVALSSGDIFCVTSEHKWLVRRDGAQHTWLKTTSLRDKKYGRFASKIPLMFHSLDDIPNYEDGWFSGILDGEGNINSDGHSISFSQVHGKVLDRAKKYLSENWKNWSISVLSRKPKWQQAESIYLRGSLTKRLDLLAKLQPTRLISNLNPNKFGILQINKDDIASVDSIKESGIQKIARIQTSTGTLFVDGVPMHNCLALGADGIITGYLLAGTNETPKDDYYGMASIKAMEDRGFNDSIHMIAPEGSEEEIPWVNGGISVKEAIEKIVSGIKIGFSYVGSRNIQELREKAEFVMIK